MLNLECKEVTFRGNYQQERRWFKTRAFVESRIEGENVLCVGPNNEFDLALVKDLALDYEFTEGDLNWDAWSRIGKIMLFDNVFCFDILEHLMNPLNFLVELKYWINGESNIFISYPYRKLPYMWGNEHFHEFRPEAFETLIDKAGYQIIEHKKYRQWHRFRFGIRPIFRFFFILFGGAVNNLYLVRLK